MKQRIVILWASGGVWRELISQIIKYDTWKNHKNPSEIIWVVNSKKYIYNPQGIDTQILLNMIGSYKDATKIFESYGSWYLHLSEILTLIQESWLDDEIVFVDVTAGKWELLEFHKQVLQESQNFLVTANKNPISLWSMDDFNSLMKHARRYDTNTTVMWWAGILNFIHERTNGIVDKIMRIEGVFSGTLGYILSELDQDKKTFSQIVATAKKLWYTEPNPWDDLNGLDVARKLVILARYAWHKVHIDDVHVSPLIDKKYAQYQWDEFLEKISQEDVYFKNKIQECKKLWKVLRYVACIQINDGTPSLHVWLESVDKNSDLWTLSWTYNIAIVETEILQSPLSHVIKSRWAWIAVTAWAVRVGISHMIPRNLPSF